MDEFVGFLICLGIFLAAVGLPIWLGLATRQSNALQHIGTRYGGKTASEHAFARAKLKFIYGQTVVRVRFRRRLPSAGGRQTEIRIQLPFDRVKLEASFNMGNTRFWWTGQEQLWKSGDERFDEIFSVRTNQPDKVSGILSATVRWQLQQLCGLGVSGLYVAIHDDEMTIATPRFLTRHQLLDDFVRLSLELYDQLMLARAVGIDFVADQTAVIDQVNCPVCACDIEGSMVVCIRCRTPHCLECWKYNGKCATFACGETRYVYPVATTPELPPRK